MSDQQQAPATGSDDSGLSKANQPPEQPPASTPPPRGPRLRVILAVLIAGVAMFLVGAKWGSHRGALPAADSQPGSSADADEHADHGRKQYYTCGMHPWVILPNPGNCPICHMTLVKLDPLKFSKEVVISPVMAQNIGVRIAPVTVGPVTSVIRTVGSVDYDETLVRDINLKIAGWVEKLHVDYVGMPVEKGQPLLEIYSPELVTAQEEYLSAFKNRPTAARPAASTGMATWEDDLLQAARKRLENFDISPEQIVELERTGKATRTMTLRSPYRGLVVAKNVLEGMKVEPGVQLFRIADLSRVWIMVTLYEYQLPFVQVGQKAVMTLSYIPGQDFEGKVAFIYPYLNAELRQVKVRLEFDNPTMMLKPGMFANVELRGTLAANRIMVPREALVDTGSRQVVFVSLGQGRFDPRTVKVGVEAADGQVVILDGLHSGDNVVTSGTFLLDSEARLRDALGKMVRGELAGQQKVQAVVAGQSELKSLPKGASDAIVAMMEGYFAIGDKLSRDTTAGIADDARKVAASIDAVLKIEIADDPTFWQRHTEAAGIRGKALEMVAIEDIAKARETFADLGTAAEKLLKATGIPPAYGKEVQALHCPMFHEGQGGTWWMQPAGDVRNPYFGKSMLQCHDDQAALPVTGAAAGKAPAATEPTSPVMNMPGM